MLDASMRNILQVLDPVGQVWVDSHFDCVEVGDTIRFLKPDRSEFPENNHMGKISIVQEMPHLLVCPRDEEIAKPVLSTSRAAEQVTNTVICHKPAHDYEVPQHQQIRFVHAENGKLVKGTTNEDLLTVLIHRTDILNKQIYSDENVAALNHMRQALTFFEQRARNRRASTEA